MRALLLILLVGSVFAQTPTPGPSTPGNPGAAANTPPASATFPLGGAQIITDERKPSPRELYDHRIHEKPLTIEKMDCQHCHPFKVEWSERKTAEIPPYKDLFVKPLKDLCHDCHRKAARVQKSVFVCSLCHHENRGILPDDHLSGWMKQHSTAGYRSNECRECHDDAYCIDCHRRFEPIRPRVHSRNYRFFHSIEARVNPASCYSCHRQSQCVECHAGESPFR